MIGALVAVGLGVLGAMVAYAALTLPNLDDIGHSTGTIKILDRHGKLIAEVGHNRENRTTVKLSEIAPVMQAATLAAEDRQFYQEGAFDVPRVVKALVVDVILRRPAQGASTITQQLAKQAFFGGNAEKSPLRKLREALLANEIDGRYTKDQILEKYLNLIYYGENAYGVENASLRYFGKHAAGLNLSEATLLAGLPQAPSFNDPFLNPSAAWTRQHYVLQGLVATGKITQIEADEVDPIVGGFSPTAAQAVLQAEHQQALGADLKNGKQSVGGQAPHFAQYVQEQLNDIFGDDPAYLNGDLAVTTTLDLDTQAKAVAAVSAGVKKLLPQRANNGALLMLDANNGGILAMVGSADYADAAIAGQFNVVTAERRPGSSFKPYVFEQAFRTGKLRPDSLLDDTRQESARLGNVADFDRQFLGRMTAARALVLSRNVAAEQAMLIAGIPNVIDFAHSLGITTYLAPNLSTAIGSSSIKMIEHAAAYAAFANGGHRVQARAILRVADGNGNTLRDLTQPAGLGDVMTPSEAYSVTQILRKYAARWSLPFRYDTAGKSGTTDNFVDAWYMAYTPDWVVATWAGHTAVDQPEEGMNQVFGTTEATAIAVPFVNSLSRPTGFTRVPGALSDCNAGDASFGATAGCATPPPTPPPATAMPSQPADTLPTSPAPEMTPTPRPTPAVSPSPCPSSTPAGSPPAAPIIPIQPCPRR